ncbi:hypothetical protein [uncultured Desulfovibrio sp.]|uniref:DUF2802 domain-containing protein n=1 Tax=Candidatus Desulfovibrio intestinavium TaxID=2838534 RepID=A0A9D2KRL3_9BACT|nr:hypothetical protein [uncultured Desulfovibrio sp.]HJA78511.1 hypothetical protein [Candidatus Desulfovibrio intestinavium]
MNDYLQLGLIILFSVMELLILCGVLFFYLRLRNSERLLNTLQGNQQDLLNRIEMNARLEKEIVATFAQRQAELRNLDEKLEQRAQTLRRLLEQAEGITRSPQFLRELILNGQRKGLSARQIARNAGLSVDEVELILSQNS